MEAIGVDFSDELLDAGQEAELAAAIEVGLLAAEARRTGGCGDASDTELIMLERAGRQAMARFVTANLRLVAMVSHREAVRARLPEDEIFQEGCLGLLEAIRRFDHRRGRKFATYALYWIRAYAQGLTASRAGELNLPVSRAVRARQLRGAEAELGQRLGRDVTATDLATELGRTVGWVLEMLSHRAAQSLQEEALAEVDLPDESAQRDLEAVLRVRIPGREVLRALDQLQRRVIELRFGFADGVVHNYSEVARVLGVSVSRVRRVESRALEALRGIYPQNASARL